MLRGLLGISCLMVAGGCVALNSGFEQTGGTEGTESSDTARSTASGGESDPSAGGPSAVTTVTPGDSSGAATLDPTDSGASSAGESRSSSQGSTDESGGSSGGSAGESDTSVGGSSETGGISCPPDPGGVVIDDAFLVNCPKEGCANRNYGQTELGNLTDGEGSSLLLLALPVSEKSAVGIAVTLYFIADEGLPGNDFSVEAYAIDPPCDWQEGEQDGDPLSTGEFGVTAADCEGNEGSLAPWSGGINGDVWDHLDLAWSAGEYSFEAGDVTPGTVFFETIFLDRLIAGPTPQALLITSNAPLFGQLSVYSAESFDPPFVDVSVECD